MALVSVIIPTYKHRDFVLETLDSVFAQTFTDYEVLVINDGSPDDTATLLRPLADTGRIRYLAQANTGQSIARNRGIAEASGEFIALLDDDDYWPPDKLEWQVAAMHRHPDAGVVAGPAEFVDVSGQRLAKGYFAPEVRFEDCLVECPFVSPGQTLIRAEVLRRAGGLNPDIWGADDWDLWLRIAKISRILMEDRTALFYRKHAGNASKSLCRMADNCLKVVDIHLGDVAKADRRRVKRTAYLWLYGTQAQPIIRQIKAEARAGHFRLLPAYCARLGRFVRVLGGSPLMLMRLVRDLLPLRLSAALHRPTSQKDLRKDLS